MHKSCNKKSTSERLGRITSSNDALIQSLEETLSGFEDPAALEAFKSNTFDKSIVPILSRSMKMAGQPQEIIDGTINTLRAIQPDPASQEFQTNERRIAVLEAGGATGTPEHERLLQRQTALASSAGIGPEELGALTTRTTSETQRQEGESRALVSRASQFLTLIDDLEITDVGFAGAAKELVNIIAGQFSEEVPFEQRQAFELFSDNLRESAMRSVSDENRFSNTDREFIAKLFPSGGPLETKSRSKMKSLVLIAFHTSRLNEAQKRQGKPGAAPLNLTAGQVRDAVRSRLLSRAEGIDIVTNLGLEIPGGRGAP